MRTPKRLKVKVVFSVDEGADKAIAFYGDFSEYDHVRGAMRDVAEAMSKHMGIFYPEDVKSE